jgi:DNA-binding response OmpR family regulator
MAHLLVIEDEAPVQDLLSMMLSQDGHKKPGDDQKGVAVLRGLGVHQQTTVIILTGYGFDEVEAKARTLGAYPILFKQRFLLHDLAPAIHAMINSMSSQRPDHRSAPR